MATTLQPIVFSSSVIILIIGLAKADPNPHDANNNEHATNSPAPWKDAHATYYGSPDGTGGGACGFTDEDKPVYGPDTTALSTALFNSGATCGACYEIKCDAKQECKPGSIVVTATDLCPPGGEGRCNTPKHHFDLSQPAFDQIAEHKAGLIPVKYRRVECKRQGGLHFTVTGNPNFNLVEVSNVDGAGDVTKLEVKVGSGWTALQRNFGEKWETNVKLTGQKLLFRVTTSDGKSVISDAAPDNWEFGQTFQGKDFDQHQ